jgi:membrane protein required for beta-lactamase induction
MTVVTAPGGAAVASFTNGYSYDLKNNLSVRADPLSGVASVIFKLDGTVVQTENSAPYAIAGDSNGAYNAWKPALGSHILVATPYSGASGTGTVGPSITVSFTVVNTTPTPTPTPKPTATPTPTPTPTPAGPSLSGMTVVTAPGGTVVAPFTNGYTYDLKNSLSVRADPLSGVASVTFKLDGTLIRTENTAPYAVAGDTNGSYTAWKPAVGNHTLVATPYGSTNASGTAGTPVSVSFTVISSP